MFVSRVRSEAITIWWIFAVHSRINGIKKSPIPADLSARDERYDYLTRYHSYLWTMSYTHGIRNETSSLYPLHITVDTVCTYSHRFQAAAQRRVPQFPSTASQLPAVLCAPGHVYYSLSMHLTYNFSKKILTYIGIIRQEFVSVFSVLFVHCRYCSQVISREVFFVSEGHRKPETYRANLCD